MFIGSSAQIAYANIRGEKITSIMSVGWCTSWTFFARISSSICVKRKAGGPNVVCQVILCGPRELPRARILCGHIRIVSTQFPQFAIEASAVYSQSRVGTAAYHLAPNAFECSGSISDTGSSSDSGWGSSSDRRTGSDQFTPGLQNRSTTQIVLRVCEE